MEEDVIEIYNNDTSPEVDFEINDVIYTDIPSGEIEEMKRDIAQNTADILLRSLITETGNKIDLEINSSTYVLVAKLYDKNNNLISTSSEINLPIESMVIGATYDAQTKEIVLTLQSGDTVRVNISDLISGLVNQDDFDALEDRVDIVEDRMDAVEEIMPTVSATGTDITLQNTKKAGMKVALGGNTSQETTSIAGGDEYDSPSPEHPQQIHTVTGNNTVTVCGKNLFDYNGEIIEDFITGSGISYTINNGIYTLNGTNTRTYIYLRYNVTLDPGTYFYSGCPSGGSTNGYSVLVNAGGQNYFDFGSGVSFTITQRETIKVYPARIGSSTITANNLQFKPMLIKGSTATSYEPYQGTSYPINLGTIELCKIGDYQDRIFKAVDGDIYYDSLTASQKAGLTYGKWYVHKETGKIILDGTETYSKSFITGSVNTRRYKVVKAPEHRPDIGYCNKFIVKTSDINIHSDREMVQLSSGDSNKYIGVIVNLNRLQNEDVSSFTSWLSSNNITIYMVLLTPTNTEITDTTLISQLEAIYLAKSAEGTTTISQTNADEPFILTATAFINANFEVVSNKVTTLSSSSTDTQYPSAKCVYDLVGNVESLLTALDVGGGV